MHFLRRIKISSSAHTHQSISALPGKAKLAFLLKDSLLYGGSAAVSKTITVITFPLIARHFTTGQYGLVDFYLVLGGLLCTLLVFGQDSAVARYMYDCDDYDERRQLISQSLKFHMGTVAVAIPILWACTELIVPAFSIRADSKRLFLIILLTLPFQLIVNFTQNILKWTFSRGRFLCVSLGGATLNAAIVLIMIKQIGMDVYQMLLVNLVVTAMTGLIGLIFIREWLVNPLGLRWPIKLLPYAVPFGIVAVLGAAMPALERYVISDLLTPEDLGFYAVGAKIALLTSFLVTAFQTAWGPFSIAISKAEDSGQTYNTVLQLFASLICCWVVLLDIFTPVLIETLASYRYLPAAKIVFPLAMASAIQSIGWVFEVGITLSKRSHLNLVGAAVFWSTSCLAILVLTPRLGLVGVAISVMIANLARSVSLACLAHRAYPIKWAYLPVILTAGLTILFGLAASYIREVKGDGYSLLAQVVCLFLIALIALTSLLSQSAREQLRGILVGHHIWTGRQ